MGRNKFKEIILILILLVGIFTNFSLISAEQYYCAEKTVDGFSCLNVPLSEVNTEYRYSQTSCESTGYCSIGTCVDSEAGTCTIGPSATCNSSRGGAWYPEQKHELPQCGFGCCLYGDQADFMEKIKCNSKGADYGVDFQFFPNVETVEDCKKMAGPKDDGACVLEKDSGRTCVRESREDCNKDGGEFYGGLLCTAPELATDCAMTKKTKCENGKVYFIDSRGNTANIYDASRVTDTNYWTSIIDVEESCKYGQSIPNSKTCGNCEISLGSTCGIYENVKPEYGNYICRDLACYYDNDGDGVEERYESGQSWCSEPIENFEGALPGKLSYRLTCFRGEVDYTLCDPFRDNLCYEDKEENSADCIPNRWPDCYYQNSTEDCLDDKNRDCKVVENAVVSSNKEDYEPNFINADGERVVASCVPKYTPAFKFWDPEGTVNQLSGTTNSFCGLASYTCLVPYTREAVSFYAEPSPDCIDQCMAVEGWIKPKCAKACTPKCLEKSYVANFADDYSGNTTEVEMNKEWVKNYGELCVSVGDCGVSTNWKEKEGYHNWGDLFFGDRIKPLVGGI